MLLFETTLCRMTLSKESMSGRNEVRLYYFTSMLGCANYKGPTRAPLSIERGSNQMGSGPDQRSWDFLAGLKQTEQMLPASAGVWVAGSWQGAVLVLVQVSKLST